jgi:FlaA1/EpsC-like NDP-sugar epimerase
MGGKKEERRKDMNITESFKGKTLLITGGTGSFGSTVLKHFLNTGIGEIRIFSRDEKKQDWMRHMLQARYPESAGKVRFYIGDVRNPASGRVMEKCGMRREGLLRQRVRNKGEAVDVLLYAAIAADRKQKKTDR